MDQYINFRVEDFVWDDSFRQWVLAPTRESDAIWTRWLADNPQSAPVAQQAREIVFALRVSEPVLSAGEIDMLVKNTISRTNQPAPNIKLKRRSSSAFHRTLWFQLAASVIVLIIAGWWLKSNNQSGMISASKLKTLLFVKAKPPLTEKINSTAAPLYVVLGDSSRIRLTPGSRISYPEKFTKTNREVYLTGEAFFEISKDTKRPFLVYANELVTKVLGTSFTIKAYESSRQVTVEVKTGRVSVFSQSDPDLSTKLAKLGLEGVILAPNQKIIYQRDEVRMVKTLVENPEFVVSKEKIPHFEFEDTPASEAFASIATAYGIDILYDEDLLSGCPLTATLDNQSLHEKLLIICKAVEADYEILDGQIIIHSNGCRN